MCGVNRLIYAAAVALFALAPLTAAAASPTPSPSLDSVLAKPPSSDFKELTTAPLHGQFTAHDWSTSGGTASADAETERTLNSDGFVDGYGKAWTQAQTQHALIEAVMAFSGGRGARSALTSVERSDKADAGYKHPDTISGIDPYYGAHFVDSTNNTIEDAFVFVKGNDLFFISVVSGKDDALAQATTQAKSQYDSAPNSTIPSAQWPENVSSNSTSPTSLFLPIGFIVGVVLAVVAFIIRRTRRASTSVYGGMGPAAAVQLSPDGQYWWDGQAWRDASMEAPPMAQRSSDGNLWWDGRNWRPVPQPAPQQPPTG